MNLKRILEILNFTSWTDNYAKFWKFVFWLRSLFIWKNGLILVGEGRHRIVYKHGNYVIKVPLNMWGLASNDKEYRTYQSTNNGWLFGVRYARCKLHWSGLLVMEYVESVPFEEMPDWAKYIDCQQVGTNRNGNMVAYDYGY